MSKFLSPLFALILIAAFLHVIEGVLHSAIRILKFIALAMLLLVAISEHACGIPAEKLLRFGGRWWARAAHMGFRHGNAEFQKLLKIYFSMYEGGESSNHGQAEK